MGIGTSLFLIAVGAILKFAVKTNISTVDLQTVGVILMVVGVLGLLLSFLWITVWNDRRGGSYDDRPGPQGPRNY
jgi:Domain of unknown function (DUF6458)